MSGSAVTTIGRYTPSEKCALHTPRVVTPSKRMVFYAHGAGGNGGQSLDATGQTGLVKIMAAIEREGIRVLSGDFGGPHTYGNDTELAAMEGAWSEEKTTGLCATDKVILIGGSMGFLSINRFAMEHPTWVAGMIGYIPAIDVEDLRTRNALGLRELENTAWNLPAGSYIGGADQTPIPTRGRPLAPENLAAVDSIPTHLFYSSGDTACTSASVDAYAAGRANVTKHLVSTTLDHSDAAILAASIDDAVLLIRGWATP